MKKLLIYSFCFLFIFCQPGKAQPKPEEWKLTDDDQKGMKQRVHECGLFRTCHSIAKFYILDSNKTVRDDLYLTYGEKNITEVEARYRHSDIKRYGRLRGLVNDAKGRDKVSGYYTKILMVKQDKLLTGYKYYDIYTICPPPDPCAR
ncbi:MAG: hypothetical protein JWN83_765 [Chitinophagaceae bacterium]|nr:hypothetical protein [Chitinophagaceae bacterium]